MPSNGTTSLEQRFWKKVDQSSDCWLWTAMRDPNGYGRVSIDNKPHLAHRVAWELTNGPIPDHLFVCHHCDNPPCCNPAHLFLGTPGDNIRDMIAKGRGNYDKREWRVPFGEAHYRCKLTAEQVRAIRAAWEPGDVYLRVAERHGVDTGTIRNIILRRTWKHLT